MEKGKTRVDDCIWSDGEVGLLMRVRPQPKEAVSHCSSNISGAGCHVLGRGCKGHAHRHGQHCFTFLFFTQEYAYSEKPAFPKVFTLVSDYKSCRLWPKPFLKSCCFQVKCHTCKRPSVASVWRHWREHPQPGLAGNGAIPSGCWNKFVFAEI